MTRRIVTRALPRVGLLFGFFLAAGVACRAQSDGYVTNSNLRGVVPLGSYQFGQIDNINLGTGTLNLNIPIATRKGRGLDTRIGFIYSSKIWTFSCVKDIQGILHCHWFPTDGPTGPTQQTSPKGNLSWDSEEHDCTDRFGNVNVQINNTNCDEGGSVRLAKNPYIIVRGYWKPAST